MIALAILAIVLSSAYMIFGAGTQTYADGVNLTTLHEHVRKVLEEISIDVRQAGFGTLSTTQSSLNSPLPLGPLGQSTPGWQGDTFTFQRCSDTT